MYSKTRRADNQRIRKEISQLRTRLEETAFTAPADEYLALSHRLDMLINQVMLSPRKRLRCGYRLCTPGHHVYQSRFHVLADRHPRRRSALFPNACGQDRLPHQSN